MMDTRNPERFGDYLIHDRLGTGGMARVYLAEYQGMDGFGKLVALKCIHSHLSEQEEFNVSFKSEARLGGYLNHPNIVQTIHFGESDGSLYLAMEYVQGLTLSRFLRQMKDSGTRIPLRAALDIGRQLSEGLAYAHTARDIRGTPLRMIHRDLKPDNILLSLYGGLKITDFGVSKATSNLVHTSVDAGIIKGTIAYMSPEQANGQELDHRSDLYSFGAIIFELLTLERLYAHATGVAGLGIVARGEIDHRLELLEGLPAPVVKIVHRLVERDRERRFQSATDARHAIMMAQAGLPPSDTPLDLGEEVRRTMDALASESPTELAGNTPSHVRSANRSQPSASHGAPAPAPRTLVSASDLEPDAAATEITPSAHGVTGGRRGSLTGGAPVRSSTRPSRQQDPRTGQPGGEALADATLPRPRVAPPPIAPASEVLEPTEVAPASVPQGATVHLSNAPDALNTPGAGALDSSAGYHSGTLRLEGEGPGRSRVRYSLLLFLPMVLGVSVTLVWLFSGGTMVPGEGDNLQTDEAPQVGELARSNETSARDARTEAGDDVPRKRMNGGKSISSEAMSSTVDKAAKAPESPSRLGEDADAAPPTEADPVAHQQDPPVAPSNPTPKPVIEPARKQRKGATCFGSLSVNTRPYSTVYLDGKRLQDTPLLGHVVTCGRHSVRLVTEDSREYSESFEASGGSMKKITGRVFQEPPLNP